MKFKTVAVDFDGVIHKYRKGWHDGTIYDGPVDGAFEALSHLMARGFAVYIFSTRDPHQINEWLAKELAKAEGDIPFNFAVIPPGQEFWTFTHILGITNKKLPAIAYIDDRAVKFRNWESAIVEVVRLRDA